MCGGGSVGRNGAPYLCLVYIRMYWTRRLGTVFPASGSAHVHFENVLNATDHLGRGQYVKEIKKYL